MKFSYEWMKELSGVSLPATEVAEILTAKAFEVKDVAGDVLDIDILANRPDCLSHLGVARELAALVGHQFTAPVYEWTVAEHPVKDIAIEDPDACPRYSALIIRGLKVGPSPSWLVERLRACGMQSINNVVDVTNYVMLELGQPLHAFDLDLIDRIVVRRARQGERLQALDEARTEYDLDESMLVIADSTKAIAVAGIKGGAATGINEDTAEILLEAANFNPESIRATSRKLGLQTDASLRFGYGVDPNLTAPALMRAAELLKKVAKAEYPTGSGIIDVYPKPAIEREILLNPTYLCSLLGMTVEHARIQSILHSLGFECSGENDMLRVVVPTRRSDVVGQEDLIEEVGRIYGYNGIAAIAPALPLFHEHLWVHEDEECAWDEYEFIRERSALIHSLAGIGYSEVYNYAFISDELKGLLRFDIPYELSVPQSGEYRWLRTSLIPRMLLNVQSNMRFRDQVRIFEVGHVFDHADSGKESARLGILYASKSLEESGEKFYELKGIVDLLARRLGIDEVSYDDAEPFLWDIGSVNAAAPGRRALIRGENEKILGFIGIVHPRIASALKIKGTAVFVELDLRALIRFAQEEREFEPLPKYPSIVRDIAVMVPENTKINEILEVIERADTGQLVRDVDVFDIFEPTGKEKLKPEGDTPEYGKSVAFHVTYRSADRTLTDDEVSVAEAAIKRALQEKLNAKIR